MEKGNPKGIRSFSDLTRKDVIYVNRQRGAGTRILLDYHLSKEKYRPRGYRRLRQRDDHPYGSSHSGKNGSATTGLGIYSAAKA